MNAMAAPTTIRWWERDAAPGALLLGATALSFLLNNSFAGEAFRGVLNAEVAGTTLAKFIKNALMAVFFLYVGLELKRECIEGPFRNRREAALPALGALGGMLAPALVYLAIATAWHPAASAEYARGWAIPAATDIAFAIGVLSLLGSRVPPALRLFLLALAIVDDLGAILAIALFYSGAISLLPGALAAALLGVMLLLGASGERRLWPYMAIGVAMWLALASAGVSPTLAGVFTAIAVPMRAPSGRSPLLELEHALKLPVQIGVMPVFALAVAGVAVAGDGFAAAVAHPVTLGIAFGLLIGKPLGIVALTWVGARVLRQPLPAPPVQLAGVALVAGVGFTMSLFVGALAFPNETLAAPVRFGVLAGSLLSAATALVMLSAALPLPRAVREPDSLAPPD